MGFQAVVLNTETMAITEYGNFRFNSFCEFAGKVLAAGPNGLFSLEGTDDAGTPIVASFQTALTDFGSSNLKQVLDVIADFGGAGIEIETVTDGGVVAADQTVISTADGIRTERIKPGRGIKSRALGFNVCNVNGGDLDLKDLEMRMAILGRKL